MDEDEESQKSKAGKPTGGRSEKKKMSEDEAREYRSSIDEAVEEANKQIVWPVMFFLLCSVPGVFNAFHILAVNFITDTPPYWCDVPELRDSNWTAEQIREVSAENNTATSNCYMIGWNYEMLKEMGYEKSLNYINNTNPKPDKVACKSYIYDKTALPSSTVMEWDLVCNKEFEKSHIQGSIATGKFIGGLIGGFAADKYGRKITFMVFCLIYFVSAVFSAITNSYNIFLVCRFLTGAAGACAYETSFTLLAELVNKKRRVGLGCMFNISYPVGYILLALLSLVFTEWRHLMMAISAPMIIFLLHLWLLPESPRWLLVVGKPEKAWQVMKKINKNFEPRRPQSVSGEGEGTAAAEGEEADGGASKPSTIHAILECAKEILSIFSTLELCMRLLICAFIFFVASLVYYVLAQNAANFGVGQVEYTIFSGLFEIPGYIAPVFVMMCVGRKIGSMILYLISGLLLIFITGLPKDQNVLILTLAMLGRFLNVVVFALVIVYCAELFPTEVRNAAIGLAVTWSQLGSIFSPYIVNMLGPIAWYIPSLLCGLFAVSSAVLVMLLPETRGRQLPETIDDVKTQPDHVSLLNCCRVS